MLVLTRKPDQSIILETNDGPITIRLLRSSLSGSRLGIIAPQSVRVRREELEKYDNEDR